MSVTVTNPVAGPFTPNSATTSFPFNFKIVPATVAGIEVIQIDPDDGTMSIISTNDYSVTIAGDGEGGTVIFDAAPATGSGAIYLRAKPAFTRSTDFTNSGRFSPASLNSPLDQLALQDVVLKERIDRAVLVPVGGAGLEVPAGTAGVIGIDEDGDAVFHEEGEFTGPEGAAGRTVLNGAGVPGGGVGSNGDFYVDTNTNRLWGPKAAGAWTTSVSLVGPAGDVAKVADRTALAAINATAGMTRYLVEAGREGVFTFSASDLSAKVAADTAQGIYVAPDSDTDGSSGAWVRQFHGVVYPEWWGIVRTDSAAVGAANAAARDAMIACLVSRKLLIVANYQSLERVQWGLAKYHFSTAYDVNKGTIRHDGCAVGLPNSIGTIWKYPAGVDGVLTQYFESSGEDGGAVAAHENSIGCTFNGIIFEGGYETGVTAEGDHHGAVVRTPTQFIDCQFIRWQGEGVKMYAGALSLTNVGNANLSRFINCTIQQCRYGVDFGGADVGVYLFEGGSIDNNRAAGVREVDNASLGGTFIGVHFDSNGASGIAGIPPSMVSHGGNTYGVIYGQEAGASTNAPSGTTADNAWWYYIGAGGAAADRPAWLSGTTYRAGGPAICKSVNAATHFSDCYSEGGLQPRPQVDAPSWISGGALASHPNIGTGPVLRPDSGDLRTSSSFRADGNIRADGYFHLFGQTTTTGNSNEFMLRSPEGFGILAWDRYTAGALSYRSGSINAWHAGVGSQSLIYATVDKHYFKTGGGDIGDSTVEVTIDSTGIDLAAGNTYKIAGSQIASTNLSDSAALVRTSTAGEVLISEQTPTGTGTVTFDPIPATYRDLRLVVRGRGTAVATLAAVNVRLNNDSGLNYDRQRLSGANGTASAAASMAANDLFANTLSIPAASATADVASDITIEIYDYRGTTFQKSGVARMNLKSGTAAADMNFGMAGGFWRNTAAVTRVDVVLGAGNFAAGSVVSLYGRL